MKSLEAIGMTKDSEPVLQGSRWAAGIERHYSHRASEINMPAILQNRIVIDMKGSLIVTDYAHCRLRLMRGMFQESLGTPKRKQSATKAENRSVSCLSPRYGESMPGGGAVLDPDKFKAATTGLDTRPPMAFRCMADKPRAGQIRMIYRAWRRAIGINGGEIPVDRVKATGPTPPATWGCLSHERANITASGANNPLILGIIKQRMFN